MTMNRTIQSLQGGQEGVKVSVAQQNKLIHFLTVGNNSWHSTKFLR